MTVGKPGGVAAADVLLASVAVRNGSVQAPAGWQLVRSDDCEIHGERLTQAVFVRTASGSEPGSYSFGLDAPAGASAAVLAYSGADPSSPVSAHSGDSRRKSEWLTAPSVSVAVANTQLVGAFSHNGAQGFGTPGGMTDRTGAVAGRPDVTASVSDQTAAAPGDSGERGVRMQVADRSTLCTIGQLVALRPGGGATGTPPPPPPPPPSGSPPAGAPQMVEAPVVTGTAREAQTLTGERGTWSGSPTGWSYAWRRCDAGGSGCSTVAGATARTYVLGGNDVGRTMRFVVTASNGSGSSSASSVATGVVQGLVNPSPTPTPPPPPPPPPGGGGEPQPGTRIVAHNRSWSCDRPLREYGPLPILVEQTWQGVGSDTPDSVAIRSNCTGDGNPGTIDLILHVNGNGRDIGGGRDAVKVGSAPGTVRPHDIEITGYANCGAPAAGAHQDGIQVMSGERITFVDFRSGDVASRAFTCRGAGGTWFVGGTPGDASRKPNGVTCIRCRMVASNHGMLVGWSGGSGARDSTFVGRLPITVNPDVTAPVNVNNVAINYQTQLSSGPSGPDTTTTTSSTPVPTPEARSDFRCSISRSTQTSVWVQWTAVSGATGFRLYVDGRAVATTGPRATTAQFGVYERRSYTLRVDALGAPGSCTLVVAPQGSGWVVVR